MYMQNPALNAQEVTNDVDLPYATSGLYVGTGGDVEVIMKAGNTVVFPDVPSGSILPIRITRVVDANTTALGLIALWN